MNQKPGISGYNERAAAAIQNGHTNRHGDVRVREVWVGDFVVLDRIDRDRRYNARVVAISDSRVNVEFTYKNGVAGSTWATPIWKRSLNEVQRVTDRATVSEIDKAFKFSDQRGFHAPNTIGTPVFTRVEGYSAPKRDESEQ